jgi:MFS family permease
MVRAAPRSASRFFYGWVIVAVSFITLFIVVGTRFSLGVFYVAILEDYQWSRAQTAGAFSLMLVVHAVFSLVVGALFDRFGPRLVFPLSGLIIALGFAACSQIRSVWQLYVYLGIIAALGISTLAFVPHMALVSAWFKRWRGTATGIAYAGIGGGQLALAPLIQGMIERFGWRGAFLGLAGLVLVIVVPLTAIFHRRRPQDVGLLPDGRRPTERPQGQDVSSTAVCEPSEPDQAEWRPGRVIRTPRFWYLIGTVGGLGVILNTLMVHLMAHLTDAGYSKLLGATLLGIVGGLRSAGGISLGPLSDRLGREAAYSVGAAMCFVGIILLMTIQDTTHAWRLYGFVLLYGIGHGALGPVYAAATADIFPGRYLGTILGFLEAAYGLGGALGTYVAGYAFDLTGSYMISFLLVLVATTLSCLSLWLAAPRKRGVRAI